MTLLYTSIAARLDAGTYSPCVVARMPVAAPTRHVASPTEPWWTYAASAVMGAAIALMLGGAL
jgi:hypothetical protein